MSPVLLALLLALPASADAPSWPDLSTPPAATAGDGSKDAALVIGIEDYTKVDAVLGARANANDWYTWLAKSRRVPLARLHRLTDAQAVDHKIRSELALAAAEVQPGGTLWVVFIGHGAPSKDGRDGLLVGADADRSADGIYQRSVSRSEVLAAVAGGRQGQTVLVLDACFSGQGQTGGALVEGLQPLVPTSARVSSGKVTVLTGAGSGEFAGRLPGTTRPAFSYLALGGLRGWADDNGDGIVSASEVAAYAQGALRATVQDRSQTPSQDGPDIALAKGREAGPDLVAFAVQRRDESDFDELVRKAQEAEAAKNALEAEVRRRLDDEASALRRQANADYAKLAPLLKTPSEAGKPVLEAYVAKYGSAKVTVSARTEGVDVPEVAKVQAALATLSGTQTGTLGYAMVRIPAGSFTMGSPSTEEGRDTDETPHKVTLSRAFLLGETEVTQGLWAKVMGDNPVRTGRMTWDSDGDGTAEDEGACAEYGGVSLVGDGMPVHCVSWCDAVIFANTLSAKEGLIAAYTLPSGFKAGMSWAQCGELSAQVRRVSSSTGYRLPTEAEWEYAGRAGEHGRFAGVESDAALCRVGNVADATAKGKFASVSDRWTKNSAACNDGVGGLAPVGSYSANDWGLYDMTGNVWEWTGDWYGALTSEAATDPTGASSGSRGVIRGGGWDDAPQEARLAFRGGGTPGRRRTYLGLRLARSIP